MAGMSYYISSFGGHLNFQPVVSFKGMCVCVSVPSGVRILLDRVSLGNQPSRQVLLVAETCRLDGAKVPECSPLTAPFAHASIRQFR